MSKYSSICILYAVWPTRETQMHRLHHQFSHVLRRRKGDLAIDRK